MKWNAKKESITQVKSTIKADAVIKIEIQIYHIETVDVARTATKPYLHIPATTAK